MLDDEMKVLGPDPASFRNPAKEGPRVNWQVVDYVIDSLLEIGIAPMFTTTFTPSAMASGRSTVFTTKSNVTPPKNPKAWADLIHDGVVHMTRRYGAEAVRQWYFEVWNEPNLDGFWDGSQDEFFELWRITHRAIKDVDPAYRVGGPSTARAEWIKALIEFGRDNDCEPDYIITHIYNNDSESKPLSPFAGPQEDKVSKSPHFASGVVRGVRELLDEMGFKGEVHWNEWGRSWFPHYPERETPNEAAFVMKTMAEVSQLADYFAYWNLSDVYDQVGYGAETFHGNYGMLNLQGLRKPQYHAFQLLSRLGDRRLPVTGDGLSDVSNAIATPTDRGFAVAVYAFDPEDGSGDTRVEVTLPDGVKGEPTLHLVDATHNNILVPWREMGSPDYLKRDQLETLRSLNTLTPSPDALQVEGSRASFTLTGPGVALLEVVTASG